MGGWVRPNAYVCLQGGWVGVAKCLRNDKNYRKGQLVTKIVNGGNENQGEKKNYDSGIRKSN